MSQKDHLRRIHGGCRLIEVCLAPKVLMTWGIDTVIPMRAHETQGQGRRERFAADEANLIEFLNAKRKRR